MSTVALGVVLGLIGSIAINTGNNLQSLGLQQLDELDSEEEVGTCSSKTWVLGTVIFVTGALLNFASYGFAAQSTLASLESIQFVTNLFFSKILLKKDVSLKMYAGTILTVGGTVLAVAFSSKEAAEVEVIADLVSLWENYLWIGYLCFLVIFAVILQLLYKFIENWEDISTGWGNAMAAIYAVLSALWGTLSVVFAKILAILLEIQASGEDVSIFTHWFTWITLLSWIVLMSFWLYRLNSALGLYNPLFIIPLLQANFIFFAIVSGGIYFKEFNYMKSYQWVGFTSGVCFMFIGIFLLVPEKLVVDASPIIELLEKPEWAKNESGVRRFSILTPSVTKRRVSMFFRTGAGMLNQRDFDIMAQKNRYQRLQNMETRTPKEEELMFILGKVISGVRKKWEKEDRYRSIQQMHYRTRSIKLEQNRLERTILQFTRKIRKAQKAIQEKERQITETEIMEKPKTVDGGVAGLWSMRLQEVNVTSETPSVVVEKGPGFPVLSELTYDWSFRTWRGSFTVSKMMSGTGQIRLNDVETADSHHMLKYPLGNITSQSTPVMTSQSTPDRAYTITEEIACPDLRMLVSSEDFEESSLVNTITKESPSMRLSNDLKEGAGKSVRF